MGDTSLRVEAYGEGAPSVTHQLGLFGSVNAAMSEVEVADVTLKSVWSVLLRRDIHLRLSDG